MLNINWNNKLKLLEIKHDHYLFCHLSKLCSLMCKLVLCFRHPNMACEVLTADVYAIIDKLTNNEVYMYVTVSCQSFLGYISFINYFEIQYVLVE